MASSHTPLVCATQLPSPLPSQACFSQRVASTGREALTLSLRGQRQQSQLLPLHSALAFPRGWLWKTASPTNPRDTCASCCCSTEVCCLPGPLPSPQGPMVQAVESLFSQLALPQSYPLELNSEWRRSGRSHRREKPKVCIHSLGGGIPIGSFLCLF